MQMDISNLEDETTTLPLDVDNQSPSEAKSHMQKNGDLKY